MSDGFKFLQYKESDCLHESGSNWTFWKTQIVPFMTGVKLWPYVSGSMAKLEAAEADKLTKWRETDAQALSIDRKSTRLNSSHPVSSRMPSSA